MLVRGCAAIEKKTFSFSGVCLEAPPPQTTCLPKRGDMDQGDSSDELPPRPGPVSESTESGEGPHFTIPSEAALPSPGAPHESVRLSPGLRGSVDSAANNSWNPARSSNGNGYVHLKRSVNDDTPTELARMKSQTHPDKCGPGLSVLSYAYIRALYVRYRELCILCAVCSVCDPMRRPIV